MTKSAWSGIVKHHPNAAGYDYSSAANDLFVQMKTLRNPDGAVAAMKKAINRLRDDVLLHTPANVQVRLHILIRPGTTSSALSQAIENHLLTLPQDLRGRFLPTIIEEFVYPSQSHQETISIYASRTLPMMSADYGRC